MKRNIIKIAIIAVALIVVLITVHLVRRYIQHPEDHYESLPSKKTVYVPLETDVMVPVSVPKNAKMVESDGISIYVYQTPDEEKWVVTKILTDAYEGDNHIKGSTLDSKSVTHSYGRYSVRIYNEDKVLKDAVIDFTKDTKVPTYYLVSENKAPALPTSVSADDAVFSKIGIYNPPQYKENVILALTANVTVHDDQFFTAYQQMGDINSIIEKQLTWLAALDPKFNPDKMKWYQDDKTWFAVSNGFYVGARYLTSNNWTLIYCTKDYYPYIVKNLTAPHPKN